MHITRIYSNKNTHTENDEKQNCKTKEKMKHIQRAKWQHDDMPRNSMFAKYSFHIICKYIYSILFRFYILRMILLRFLSIWSLSLSVVLFDFVVIFMCQKWERDRFALNSAFHYFAFEWKRDSAFESVSNEREIFAHLLSNQLYQQEAK